MRANGELDPNLHLHLTSTRQKRRQEVRFWGTLFCPLSYMVSAEHFRGLNFLLILQQQSSKSSSFACYIKTQQGPGFIPHPQSPPQGVMSWCKPVSHLLWESERNWISKTLFCHKAAWVREQIRYTHPALMLYFKGEPHAKNRNLNTIQFHNILSKIYWKQWKKFTLHTKNQDNHNMNKKRQSTRPTWRWIRD